MSSQSKDNILVSEEEGRAVIRGRTRYLHHHEPKHPCEVLAELAENIDVEEVPDNYGAGALIQDFEREVAGLLGKEAALFLPTGIMAQLIAVRIWCQRKGINTVAFHPTCHLEMSEQKGYQWLHGLHGRLVGDPRRLLTLDDLKSVTEPVAVLLLELPQRKIGGQLPSWNDLLAQANWARERGIALHMDGARLWQAGPFYDRPYSEIAGLFDTVYVSFYKDIGALAGAVLAGPADVIAEAKIWQRRHGGNFVQLYPYVVSARVNLGPRLARLPHHRERAIEIARALAEVPGVVITPNPPQTNMMHIMLHGNRDRLIANALDIASKERVMLLTSFAPNSQGTALAPTDLPDWWSWELCVLGGADAFTDEEIVGYFRRLVEC